jgi:glycosyltransferase involved in cell wall biosynthesis
VSAEAGSRGDAPRVSVIIPVFNMRAYVGEAIESVLAQNLPPEAVEIIAVDDGSTDGSDRVIASHGPRVHCVQQENRGLAPARNAGIRAARAPFLSFLDADDRFLPDKLAAELELFEARPSLGLVYSGFRYVDATGQPLPQVGWARLEGSLFARLVLGNVIHPLQALVRREAVARAGGFDERLGPAADWDLWLRVSRDGLRWGCVDRPLAEYRIRPDAMHQDVGRMAEDCLQVLGKVFGDPALPPEVATQKARAYQRVYLTAACDHYRIGERAQGARWLRAAAAEDRAFFADPESWRTFCRGLVPLGWQRGTVLVADLPRLANTVRLALADLLATSEPDGTIGRLRWRTRLAAARALLPLARKRIKASFRRTEPVGAP